MGRPRKIKDEEVENDVKNITLETETDVDTLNVEAENINEMQLEIYNKVYTVSELINLTKKDKKTYLEQETVNRFVELMYNYYQGIKYALFRSCCGKQYSVEEVKNKLKENKNYEIIDRRCSRGSMRFDKITVDTVIKFVEEYERQD